MPKDKVPIFDGPSHTYTDPDDNFKYTSVTRFLDRFKPHFDEQTMAKRIAQREGISVECILEMWEEKREKSKVFGTRVHKILELYHTTGKNSDKEYATILNKFKELDVKLDKKNTFFEKLVYNRKFGIAGMSDVIMHNADKKTFNVYDFNYT